jgi:hypothetical protein
MQGGQTDSDRHRRHFQRASSEGQDKTTKVTHTSSIDQQGSTCTVIDRSAVSGQLFKVLAGCSQTISSYFFPSLIAFAHYKYRK